MGCEVIKVGDSYGFLCGRGRGKKRRCVYCGGNSDALCDYPVSKNSKGKWKTCDRDMCSKCTQKGVSANVDFCREHFPLAKAAYERRQAAARLALSNTEIIRIFKSTTCRCSGKKWANKAFCYGCYDDLSRETRKALTNKFGQGFETAYRKACEELDGAKSDVA